MPRSVYRPLRHMSNSPCAHAPHGSGSGRRTTPTTRSPAAKPDPVGRLAHPAERLVADDQPLAPRRRPAVVARAAISWSVPHTPTASASTSSSPAPAPGRDLGDRQGAGVHRDGRQSAHASSYPLAPCSQAPGCRQCGAPGESSGARPIWLRRQPDPAPGPACRQAPKRLAAGTRRLGGVVGEAVGADRVVPGLQDVADHQHRDVQLGGHPDHDREPVELVRLAAGRRRGPAAEVEPDARRSRTPRRRSRSARRASAAGPARRAAAATGRTAASRPC